MAETGIVKEIRVAVARAFQAPLFVNLVGTAWFGAFVAMKDNVLSLRGARRKDVGLGDGSPDLIGWRTIRITAEMVGKSVAVFTGIEVKVPGENPRPDQLHWQKVLRAAGAICGVAHSPQEALQIMRNWEIEYGCCDNGSISVQGVPKVQARKGH